MSQKIDELIGTGVIEKTKADYIKEKLILKMKQMVS